MTYENANGTLTDMGGIAESTFSGAADENIDVQINETQETDTLPSIAQDLQNADTGDNIPSSPSSDGNNERAEYERLIRTRFKEFYTDDTQKMINKRFKRYKAMEQRLCELEEQTEKMRKRESELDDMLAKECARVESETERRIISEMNAMRQRPIENGYAPHRVPAPFNVSSLTKSQRAEIAKRAFGGEKISF